MMWPWALSVPRNIYLFWSQRPQILELIDVEASRVFLVLFLFLFFNQIISAKLTIILNPLCAGAQQVHSQTCVDLTVWRMR